MHKKLLLGAGLCAVLLGIGTQTQANAQVFYGGSCGMPYDVTYSSPVVIDSGYGYGGFGYDPYWGDRGLINLSLF